MGGPLPSACSCTALCAYHQRTQGGGGAPAPPTHFAWPASRVLKSTRYRASKIWRGTSAAGSATMLSGKIGIVSMRPVGPPAEDDACTPERCRWPPRRSLGAALLGRLLQAALLAPCAWGACGPGLTHTGAKGRAWCL